MKDGGHGTGGLTESNLYSVYEGQWSGGLSHNGMPELPAAFIQHRDMWLPVSDKNKTYTVW